MKKKIAALSVILSLSIFSLVGCSSEYPIIKIYNSIWSYDETDINVGDKYRMKDYTKDYNDNECTVTIHFESVDKK